MTEERRKRVLSAFLAFDPDRSNHPTCRRSLFRSRARFEACCRCVAPKPQLSVDSSLLLLPFIAFIRYAVMQIPHDIRLPLPGIFNSLSAASLLYAFFLIRVPAASTCKKSLPSLMQETTGYPIAVPLLLTLNPRSIANPDLKAPSIAKSQRICAQPFSRRPSRSKVKLRNVIYALEAFHCARFPCSAPR